MTMDKNEIIEIATNIIKAHKSTIGNEKMAGPVAQAAQVLALFSIYNVLEKQKKHLENIESILKVLKINTSV